MKDNLTEIIVVLDKSGSMGSVRDDAIGGFNQFLEKQKEVPGEANLTMVQFNTTYDTVYDGVPLSDVAPLTKETYVPGGLTSLLDAIGRAITDVGTRLEKTAEVVRPGKVIMVIITDGQENSSKEYKRSAILDMINTQRDEFSWDFIFLAADEGGIKDAQSIGIQSGKRGMFSKAGGGTRAVYDTITQSITSYRTGGSSDLAPDDDSNSMKPVDMGRFKNITAIVEDTTEKKK